MNIFLVPGFLGGKEELNPLLFYLKNKGFFVYKAIISGHGRGNIIPSYQFWINEVCDQYLEFSKDKKDIIIIGFSMGGVLACNLSKYNLESKMILLSPSFKHIYFNDFYRGIKDIKEIFKTSDLNIKNRNIIYGVRELKKLTSLSIEEEWLKKVNSKILYIHGSKDNILRESNNDYILNTLKDKKDFLFYKSDSGHFVIYDDLALEKIYDFIIDKNTESINNEDNWFKYYN